MDHLSLARWLIVAAAILMIIIVLGFILSMVNVTIEELFAHAMGHE